MHSNAISWQDWRSWPLKNISKILLLGFSSGLPIFLIFSTLSVWLGEAGVEKSTVTYFSWAALGYSFKFVWAPIVDKLPLPLISATLGRRRSWLLLSQFAVMAAILWMASVDPANSLKAMAFGAVALGFSSATQDIVIDAYRIETAGVEQQALLSSCYIAGYRIGTILAVAGAFYTATYFGSTKESYSYTAWQITYGFMAATMLIGVITTLLISEPQEKTENPYPYSVDQYLRFLLLFTLSVVTLILVFVFFPEAKTVFDDSLNKVYVFAWNSLRLFIALGLAVIVALGGAYIGLVNKAMVVESYISPIQEFFQRYGQLALWILLLVGFYRVSDIVMGVIANPFYQDLGYTKIEMANITKVFGVIMTILGSFIGGFLSLRWGVMRVLLLGAILAAITNLLFVWLANAEPTKGALIMVIAADNLSAGLAVAAFVAWLSSLTSVSFTATQYAIFSSVMTLFPKLIGGYSGTIVKEHGYSDFFLMTAALGVPVIVLILFLSRRFSN